MENKLPKGWDIKKIGELLSKKFIIEIKSGFPSGKHSKVGNLIHLRPMNINRDGDLEFNICKYVEADKEKVDFYMLKKGDILFNNTNSPELVGKTTIFDSDKKSVFSNHITRIKTDPEKINPKYLALYLHNLWRKGFYQQICINHVSQAGINNSILKNVEVVLPPFETQNKIVNSFNRFYNSYKILKEESKNSLDQNTKLVQSAIEKALNLPDLVKTYGEKPIGDKDLSLWITQGPNPKYDGVEEEEYRVMKTKDIYDDVIYYNKADKITKKIFDEFNRFELTDGDFLISLVGVGSIGKVNIFRKQNDKRYIFTRATGIIRLNKEEMRPDFLYLFFRSLYGKKMIENGISGTTGQLVIKTSYIKSIKIPVPPIHVQDKIIASTRQIFDQLNLMTKEKKILSKNIEILPSAVLSKAFKGEI